MTDAIYDAFRADGASTDAVDALASLELSAADLLDVDPAEVWGVDDADAERIAATCVRLKALEHGPLLFLDIDGVLNRHAKATHVRLDEDLVERLSRVLAATRAKVVFSTYWREFDAYLRYVLGRYGIDAFAGATRGTPATRPEDRSAVRGEEIASFLADCAPGCRYVILDDRDDFLPGQRAHLVRTDPGEGLTEADAARALGILRAP